MVLNLPFWQRVSDAQLFEDFHTWLVEEEKNSDFLDSMNNEMKADYGSVPQQPEANDAS